MNRNFGKSADRGNKGRGTDLSTSQIAENAGRPRFSRAAGKLMEPEKVKKIATNSPEGLAIIERYK